jgi:hypothetical protein
VGLFVTANLLPPQFIHQAVLMRPMHPLHSSLGLQRPSRDQLNPQLRAHAPKLRDRLLSPQPVLRKNSMDELEGQSVAANSKYA